MREGLGKSTGGHPRLFAPLDHAHTASTTYYTNMIGPRSKQPRRWRVSGTWRTRPLLMPSPCPPSSPLPVLPALRKYS